MKPIPRTSHPLKHNTKAMSKNKVKVGEHFSHKITAPPMKGKVEVVGVVTHYINGKKVFVKRNTISADLFGYFRDSMDTVVDKAINALFSAAEVAPGGAQDGNDGLAMFDDDAASWLTFDTVTQTPVETYGKKWRGTVTTSQARTITQVALGHSYEAGSPPFDTTYGSQTFAGLALQSGATYQVDYEIYVQAAA